MAILEARNVTREYRMKAETVRALAEVSVAVECGDFVAILGTSGSGKSTLLNLFGGLDRPTSGEILFDGQSLEPLSSWEMSRYRLRRVGMIFQSFNLIPTMTARENVALALAFAGLGHGERRRLSLELLDRVGLLKRADHLPSELSGGEQARVALARALVARPCLLLADEPTGDLDSKTSESIHSLLKEVHRSQQLTSVIVTHNERLASICDRVLHLEDGQLRNG